MVTRRITAVSLTAGRAVGDYTQPHYCGSTILDQPEADIVLNAALKACDPKTVKDEPFTRAYFDKIEKLAPFWDATDPDLHSFAKAGGKLILWQGEADYSIPAITSTAYYQAVVQAMGGLQATRAFARDYALPGVGHCGGNGPGAYNGVGAVVAWAEKHVAPQALVAMQYAPAATTPPGPPPPGTDLTNAVPALGAPATTAVVRQIKLFPYPELPAYNGYGNVDDASSYVGRVSIALQQPAPWLGKFDTSMI